MAYRTTGAVGADEQGPMVLAKAGEWEREVEKGGFRVMRRPHPIVPLPFFDLTKPFICTVYKNPLIQDSLREPPMRPFHDPKRRGAHIDPPNRFDRLHQEIDYEHLEHDPDAGDPPRIKTEFLRDESRSVVTENDSPDVRFRYSLNPYRGCEHGCAYCYARPYHELLGYSAGVDFESKILVKEEAPALLRDFLASGRWQCEPIVLSGVTDCYQPAERLFRLTRQCLEVMLEAHQPVEIITKNRLIVRDLDLLSELAARRLVQANISVTTLDDKLARSMEPRTSLPAQRLEGIQRLSAAGVPVRVMVAPIVPGLTDSEIPRILAAAADAGAQDAGYVLLRLPGNVQPVFLDWLQREQPAKQSLVTSRIRSTRTGRMNDATFGSRMRGEGEIADQISALFKLFKRKYGLDQGPPELDCSRFQPPVSSSGQQWLF